MRNEIIPYDPWLKAYARELRKNPTPAEAHLWKFLRRKQIMGYEFHRQVPIGSFIVDFYCHELKLALEVDGGIHKLQVGKDRIRQKELEGKGIGFLRFENEEVLEEIAKVIRRIKKWIEGHS